MHVLVTGASGFIPAHIVECLLEKGASVTGVDMRPSQIVHKCYRHVQTDLTTLSFGMPDRIGKADITHIVHAAAHTHVDASINCPEKVIANNVMATTAMLDYAKNRRIERFLYVSTDEVYGELEQSDHPWTENALISPRNPYSASKAAGEHIVNAYRNTYGVPAVVVRPCNAFGPRQAVDKFVPVVCLSLLEEKEIPVYGNGQQRRTWCYVKDTARAIVRVLLEGEDGGNYNIGGTECMNLDIAYVLAAISGKKLKIRFVKDRPGHDFRYALSDTRLRLLDFEYEHSIKDALATTYRWYEANP